MQTHALVTLNVRKTARHIGRVVKLSLDGEGKPPTEFRIFEKGWNETDNGRFLFDEKAAKAVMAAFESHGADRMIDLEHLSLDPESSNYDPDARGWCRLELRNGELWACDVSWTADGAQRLSEKRQRYISPAFKADPKSKRVMEILNIAITALPATHNLDALVAANNAAPPAKPEKRPMDKEMMEELAEALGLDDSATIADIYRALAAVMKEMQDALMGNGADDGAPSGDDGVPPDAQDLDPAAMSSRASKAAQAIIKLRTRFQKSSADVVALRDLVFSKTGKKTASEALSVIDVWEKSHANLVAEQKKIADQKLATEATEREQLCTELVTCGAATPAMVWAEGSDGNPDKKNGPAPMYARMTIDELRKHVKAAKSGGVRATPTSPAAPAPSAGAQGAQRVKCRTVWGQDGEVELTAAEIERCSKGRTPEQAKVQIEKYAGVKLAMQLRKAG